MATFTFTGALTFPIVTLSSELFPGYYYAYIADGNLYMSKYFNNSYWLAASDIDKMRALAQATQMIDSLSFLGRKTDEDQVLEFPRYPDTEIPQDIEDATVLIANALFEGIDVNAEYENIFVTSQRFDVVATTYDRKQLPEHFLVGIPSLVAWRLLRPYLNNKSGFRINRVS